MKKFTATQLNKETNTVLNEATREPVLIDHKRRGAEFVMLAKDRYDEMLHIIQEANRQCYKLDKREGKDESK